MITQERLKQLVSYDAESGLFVWLPRPESKKWTTRHAGKIAGTKDKLGRICLCIFNKKHFAHRLAWLYMTGSFPIDQTDHRDGDPSNNRFANLREATQTQNQHNTKTHGGRKRKYGTLKGAYFSTDLRKTKSWYSQIQVDGKRICLGTFSTEAEAHAAYVVAAKQHCGEFARVS